MVAVSVQIIGIQSLQQSIQTLHDKIDDPKDLLTQGSENYYARVRDRFAEGQFDWTPLSDRRVAERGADGPILIDTGALYEAATGTGMWGHGGADIAGYRDLYHHSMHLRLEGAKVIHNEGGENTEGRYVPQREFWPWQEYPDQECFFEPFEKMVDGWLSGPQQIGFWGS